MNELNDLYIIDNFRNTYLTREILISSKQT